MNVLMHKNSEKNIKIRISGLSYTFQHPNESSSVRVLDNISLDIYEKEFFCVLGPSGCGKTTLLYLIAGLLDEPHGSILVNGERVIGPGADRGVVFQEYALLPWKTVRDNVALGLKIRGLSRQERSQLSQKYINMVHLTGFEEKYPHELSGGMKQRVAIARTLANSPDIILMDEPFAAVDAQTRSILQEELLSIWEAERKTVVFVTHNIEEAIFLGNRVLVMSPRPARIRTITDANFGDRKRTWATINEDERFRRLARKLNEMIRRNGEQSV